MSETEPTGAGLGRLAELRTSARGWHGVQLAVLGFIGLCGVLKQRSSEDPLALQVVAGILALVALAVACYATYLVARAAWPLYGADRAESPADDPDDLESTSHRLRRGLALTFAAVAIIALSAASGWWPLQHGGTGDGAGFVELHAGGQSWCGQLAAGQDGAISLVTADGPVAIPVGSVTAIAPAVSCT